MSEDKQIEEMLKCVCQNCRYFMKCNDDTIYNGETLSEVLKRQCSIWQIGEAIYNAGYRKQSEGEWEIVKGSNGQEKMVCTNCRHGQDLHSAFTYCPNCGARMHGAKMKGGAE